MVLIRQLSEFSKKSGYYYSDDNIEITHLSATVCYSFNHTTDVFIQLGAALSENQNVYSYSTDTTQDSEPAIEIEDFSVGDTSLQALRLDKKYIDYNPKLKSLNSAQNVRPPKVLNSYLNEFNDGGTLNSTSPLSNVPRLEALQFDISNTEDMLFIGAPNTCLLPLRPVNTLCGITYKRIFENTDDFDRYNNNPNHKFLNSAQQSKSLGDGTPITSPLLSNVVPCPLNGTKCTFKINLTNLHNQEHQKTLRTHLSNAHDEINRSAHLNIPSTTQALAQMNLPICQECKSVVAHNYDGRMKKHVQCSQANQGNKPSQFRNLISHKQHTSAEIIKSPLKTTISKELFLQKLNRHHHITHRENDSHPSNTPRMTRFPNPPNKTIPLTQNQISSETMLQQEREVPFTSPAWALPTWARFLMEQIQQNIVFFDNVIPSIIPQFFHQIPVSDPSLLANFTEIFITLTQASKNAKGKEQITIAWLGLQYSGSPICF